METQTTKKIGAFMHRPVLYANVSHTLAQVSRLFMEVRIHHLPVLNEGGQLVGMLSTNDLLRAYNQFFRASGSGLNREGEENQALKVSDLMTPAPLITISERTGTAAAAQMMIREGIRALPVTNDQGNVVGILTSHDLVRFCAQNPE